MKTTLINSMVSFTLGTGAAIAVLASWTGTTDLQAIKTAVQEYTQKADEQVGFFINEYQVAVNEANAEVSEYQEALAQANDNIATLITAYEDKVAEMESNQNQMAEDYAELQQELTDMQVRLEEQYEADMNAVIEEANAQIEQANQEVAQAKQDVQNIMNGSGVGSFTIDDHKEHLPEVNTDGDKTVTDISGVVGEEQPAE